jgi:hypothetical protein
LSVDRILPISGYAGVRHRKQWASSEAAFEIFIAHCDVAARDLLMPYGDLVIVLSTLLRIRRSLDGAEIDKIIWEFETHKASAAERRRRADWRKGELAASRFRVECDHLDAARKPGPCPKSGAIISELLIGRHGEVTGLMIWPPRAISSGILLVAYSLTLRCRLLDAKPR